MDKDLILEKIRVILDAEYELDYIVCLMDMHDEDNAYQTNGKVVVRTTLGGVAALIEMLGNRHPIAFEMASRKILVNHVVQLSNELKMKNPDKSDEELAEMLIQDLTNTTVSRLSECLMEMEPAISKEIN